MHGKEGGTERHLLVTEEYSRPKTPSDQFTAAPEVSVYTETVDLRIGDEDPLLAGFTQIWAEEQNSLTAPHMAKWYTAETENKIHPHMIRKTNPSIENWTTVVGLELRAQ
ncbi:hypothetical protein SKAU_G00267850 [Synaphobranchus kaupii]|uniref:Uncharacterized protein n=1 Tax=Synaphobranchus kaupii TaxID=118154 RepID=A0A9Q1IQA3_SYNKA|nr:hypothetical protein SKAU_G00267850 [Synaphobranchus kaupii]